MTFNFGPPAAAKPTFSGFGGVSQAPATPSLFGAPQPAQGSFGQPAAAPGGGGLFGASAAPASTSLFGSAPAASTGLFGSTPAAPAPSLFGAAPAAPTPSLFGQQQPAAPTQSLFGAPAASTSLFGAPQPQQPQFGAPQQQQQPAAAPATSNIFGQSQLAASTSLFGAPKPASSLFPSQQPSLSLSLQQSQQQQQPLEPVPKLGDPYPPPDPNEASIESRIEALKLKWDTTNPACSFQTYFYNEPTPPNTVDMYTSPLQGVDPKKFEAARRANPDPERLVPALAVGFPALRKRIDAQTSLSAAHQSRLSEIQSQLSSLSESHALNTTVRALRAAQTGAALAARVVALAARASSLSPNRNASVRKEEEELRVRLEGMQGEVEDVMGRGNELWAGVGALKARRMEGERDNWSVVDEEGLNQVLEILASQQAGLDHLTKTLNAATEDINVIKSPKLSFPLNTLPAEFEENHGSVDLGADEKPGLDGDEGEDEDLDLSGLGQRVWLVKVPKFLMERWSETKEEGVILGRVRVYEEKDSNGDQKIKVLLNDPPPVPAPAPVPSTSASEDVKGKAPAAARRPIPLEYKLTLQNTATKNMYIFGEKEEEVEESGAEGHRKRRRIASIKGTVHHEASLTPDLSGVGSNSYREIMRERQRKASEPKRTIQRLDVDQGTANRLAAGQGLPGLNGIKGRASFVKVKPTGGSSNLRAARIPRNELLDLLFALFESKPYWQIKALTEHVQQPQTYLKEVLADIGILVGRGPYNGMWTLKDEYKSRGDNGAAVPAPPVAGPAPTTGDGDVKPKPEELDDADEDDDSDSDDMEVIA